MEIKEVFRKVAKLTTEIKELEMAVDFDYGYLNINYDESSADDMQVYYALLDVYDKLHDVKNKLEYHETPVDRESVLHKNLYGRYVSEDGYEFSCGCHIEYLKYLEGRECYTWKNSRIEADENGYYIVGDRDIRLDGLRVRFRR